MQITPEAQQQWIEEIREAMGFAIPDGALTMQELIEQSSVDGVNIGRKRLAKWMNEQIEQGNWQKGRRGQTVYYWKINGVEPR